MAVDFRCENCGKLLSVDSEPGSTVRCPHCRKKVAVPAALASLPRPQVPAGTSGTATASPPLPASSQQPPPQQQAKDGEEGEEEEEEQAPSGVVGAMASVMPWVISAFLHLGFFLILLFFVMAVAGKKEPDQVIIPDAVLSERDPGGVMDPKTDKVSKERSERRTVVKRYTKREEKIESGETEQKVELLAPSSDGAKGGAEADLGLTDADARGGPKSNFFGSGGNAYHVVYVVDRSGSMAPTFDEVRIEMLKSISRLKPVQDFHIILFANNQVIEGPKKQLVPADIDNKLLATRFLKSVSASGQTTVLAALQRAFAVLKYADPKKPGKLIYLLSDGDFAGVTGGSSFKNSKGEMLNGNEAAIAWLRENNTKKDVYVNTFLYREKQQSAVKVMQTVAADNGGRYKFVSADE